MPATYDKIQSVALTGSQTSVTFSSIPNTYTDLVLIASPLGVSTGGAGMSVKFNGINTGYVFNYMYGTGSGNMSTGRNPDSTMMNVGNVSSTSSTTIANIQNYSNSSTYKSVISRSSTPNYDVTYAATWLNNAVISSMNISIEGGSSFATGSTFTLYGIRAA